MLSFLLALYFKIPFWSTLSVLHDRCLFIELGSAIHAVTVSCSTRPFTFRTYTNVSAWHSAGVIPFPDVSRADRQDAVSSEVPLSGDVIAFTSYTTRTVDVAVRLSAVPASRSLRGVLTGLLTAS